MGFRRFAAVVLATGLVLGSASGTSVDTARAELDWLGVNSARVIREGQVTPGQFYNRLQGMGGNLLRENIDWNATEPNNDDYRWQKYDNVIHNAPPDVGVVLVIVDSPQWARDPAENLIDCLNIAGCRLPPAPSMLDEWKEFVRTAVSRYHNPEQPGGRRLVGVEVWNEPNYKIFWRPNGNEPGRWATLVVKAAEAVAEVDPTIPIITGGLGPARGDNDNLMGMMQGPFLNAAFNLNPDLANAVDAIGIHPYTGQMAPDDPHPRNLYARTFEEIPPVVLAHDPGTPLWVTETGLSTGGDPERAITEAEQAAWLMQIYDDLDLRSDVEAMVIHTLYDQPSQNSAHARHHGIVRIIDQPKLAWTAFHDRFGP
jgi:hypothetical protein